MAFPTRPPILMAHNPPPFSVDPAGDIETIGFLLTASGNALLVALVGAPIVMAVNLDCADDEVQTCSEDSAGVRRENQGRADGARNVPETMPRLVGAQATALGKAEDTALVAADVGVAALGVRQDVPGSLVDADGDYANLQVDATGQLRVGGAAPTGLGKAEDAAAVAADVGVPAYAVRQDTEATSVDAAGDYEGLHTDAVGALRVRPSAGATGGQGQVAVTAADTAVVAASATRREILLWNIGSRDIDIFLAGAAGAFGTGARLPTPVAGAPVVFRFAYRGAVRAIRGAAGANGTLCFAEVSD